MKKSTLKAADELTKLIGCTSFIRISQRCTGKWAGSTDYGLRFDNGCEYFLSNGIADFEQRINEVIAEIKNVADYKEQNLHIIRHQVDLDNKQAAKEGLHSVKVLDIAVDFNGRDHFLWAYLLTEVNGRRFRHITTMLNYHLKSNSILQWVQRLPKQTTTAAGIENPDYILGNVRFSSENGPYKIK